MNGCEYCQKAYKESIDWALKNVIPENGEYKPTDKWASNYIKLLLSYHHDAIISLKQQILDLRYENIGDDV
jgi:hypothetical protein